MMVCEGHGRPVGVSYATIGAVSPARLGAGAPGNRLHFVGEMRRTEWDVGNSFGGSNCAAQGLSGFALTSFTQSARKKGKSIE
jgi:hypothetical protein